MSKSPRVKDLGFDGSSSPLRIKGSLRQPLLPLKVGKRTRRTPRLPARERDQGSRFQYDWVTVTEDRWFSVLGPWSFLTRVTTVVNGLLPRIPSSRHPLLVVWFKQISFSPYQR